MAASAAAAAAQSDERTAWCMYSPLPFDCGADADDDLGGGGGGGGWAGGCGAGRRVLFGRVRHSVEFVYFQFHDFVMSYGLR